MMTGSSFSLTHSLTHSLKVPHHNSNHGHAQGDESKLSEMLILTWMVEITEDRFGG